MICLFFPLNICFFFFFLFLKFFLICKEKFDDYKKRPRFLLEC